MELVRQPEWRSVVKRATVRLPDSGISDIDVPFDDRPISAS